MKNTEIDRVTKLSHDNSNPETDLLGYQKFASNLVGNLLLSFAEGNDSFVIGITGEWGSGKSVLMKYIQDELTKQHKSKELKAPVIFNFNSWMFAGQADLYRSFFQELNKVMRKWQKEISECIEKATKVKNNLKEIVDIVEKENIDKINEKLSYSNKVKSIFSGKLISSLLQDILGENISDYITILADVGMIGKTVNIFHRFFKGKLSDNLPIEEVKEKINKKLTESKSKIFIFIDDVDRLNPDQILQIFQLVKVNANLANTVFFIAFDKQVVCNAIETKYKYSGNEYLEKIIQLEYPLPVISKNTIKKLLINELAEFLDAIKVENYSDAIRRIDDRYYLIDGYIKTIRDVKRLMNSLKARLPLIVNEICIQDFVYLEILKLHDINAYHYIQDKRKKLVEVSFVNPSDITPDQPEYQFNKMSIPIISELFTDINSGVPLSNNAICHGIFFDRYFEMEIDPLTDVEELFFKDFILSHLNEKISRIKELGNRFYRFEYLLESKIKKYTYGEEQYYQQIIEAYTAIVYYGISSSSSVHIERTITFMQGRKSKVVSGIITAICELETSEYKQHALRYIAKEITLNNIIIDAKQKESIMEMIQQYLTTN
jgi:Cdc6-like AAA superfamily ATPase